MPVLIVPDVFVWLTPTVELVTLTLTVQLPPGATPLPPLKLNVTSPCDEPGDAVPPHVVVKLGVAATDRPAGKASMKLMPVSVTELLAGLPIVNVRVELAPAANDVGENAFENVGVTKTLVASLAELLPVLPAGSLGLETETVFVTPGNAPAVTATVSVMRLP